MPAVLDRELTSRNHNDEVGVKCGEVDHVLEGPAPLSIPAAFVPQSILRTYVLRQAVHPTSTFVLQIQNLALCLLSNLFRHIQVSLPEKMRLCAPNAAATSGPEPAGATTYMRSEPLTTHTCECTRGEASSPASSCDPFSTSHVAQCGKAKPDERIIAHLEDQKSFSGKNPGSTSISVLPRHRDRGK